MERMGMLINYEFCTGCHSCEVACQMEHGLPAGQFGIKIAEIGPWQFAPDTWQYAYVPVPTDQCNLCLSRTSKGKMTMCEQHCQAKVLKVGPAEELKAMLDAKDRQVIFIPKQ